MTARSTTVVVDTNVFSADLLRATNYLVELYQPLLAGRRFLISFQTVAEIRFGLVDESGEPPESPGIFRDVSGLVFETALWG